MTSSLKAMGNSDLRETRQIIYHSEGNDEIFPKCNCYCNRVTEIKSCGQLSEILTCFGRFYHDASMRASG